MQAETPIKENTDQTNHIPPYHGQDWQADRVRSTMLNWTGICSGSYYAAGLETMRQALLKACEPLLDLAGLERSKHVHINDDGVISIRCRPEAPFRILCNGHYDTVFGPEHPFKDARWISPTVLNAPGCVDMKGGLLVMVLALEELEKHSDKSAIGWEILMTPDEETGSKLSNASLREAAKRNHLGLVFEPAFPDGNIVRNRKGTGTFEARVTGRAVHSGCDFENGRNAIAALCQFIDQFEAINGRYPGAILNTGRIGGGGALNAVPDRANAHFHIRVDDQETFTKISEDIQSIMDKINQKDGIEISWHGNLDRPPKNVGPDEKRFFDILKECSSEMDIHLGWTNTGGGSDGNILVDAGLPTLDGMGPCGDNLHNADEYVHVDSISQRAQIHARFMMRIAKKALNQAL